MSSVKLRPVALRFLGCVFGGESGGVELECNESQWEREGEGISPTGKRVGDKNGEDPPTSPRKCESKTQRAFGGQHWHVNFSGKKPVPSSKGALEPYNPVSNQRAGRSLPAYILKPDNVGKRHHRKNKL